MNAMLQQMAREREARKEQDVTNAEDGADADAGFVGANSGEQGAAGGGAGEEGGGDPQGITASPGRTEESKRKRKGAPKRRPQPGEGGQVGGDQPAVARHDVGGSGGRAGGGGLDFGAMFEFEEEAAPKPRKKPQRKTPGGGGEGAEAGQGGSAKKEKKPRKEAAALEGEFGGDEGEFDAADLAAVFVRGDYMEGRVSAGEMAYDLHAREARVYAVSNGKAEVSKRSDGSLSVKYTGQDRKTYRDVCPQYSEEQAEQVIAAILATSSTSSRGRARSNKHLVTLDGLASRCPPILWAMYRANGKSTAGAIQGLLD